MCSSILESWLAASWGFSFGKIMVAPKSSLVMVVPIKPCLEPKTLQKRTFGGLSYTPSHIHHQPTLMCVFFQNKCIGVIGVLPPILSNTETLWFFYQPSLIQWKILLQTDSNINSFSKQLIDRISLIRFNCQELVSYGDSKESLKQVVQIGLPKHLEILNANEDGGFFGGWDLCVFWSCLVDFAEEIGGKMREIWTWET